MQPYLSSIRARQKRPKSEQMCGNNAQIRVRGDQSRHYSAQLGSQGDVSPCLHYPNESGRLAAPVFLLPLVLRLIGRPTDGTW
jgi:hypothetical protein